VTVAELIERLETIGLSPDAEVRVIVAHEVSWDVGVYTDTAGTAVYVLGVPP
jgi:hypothetical protein